MAIRDIITYPDPLLLKPSETVTEFGDSIQELIEDMAETMFEAPGSGLAAVQVGVNKRIIVVNTTEDMDDAEKSWYALINPEIIEKDGVFVSDNEGCLSVPELRATVRRSSRVVVKALDRMGEPMTIEVDNFHAVILQHEIDHLNGILFIDHLSVLKRNLYKKKVKKHLKDS
ncbi:MAG: peptide deformylase [Proteobacteria bacterium]|nr:peptide deformylase [Pseudomonadota bacterium]